MEENNNNNQVEVKQDNNTETETSMASNEEVELVLKAKKDNKILIIVIVFVALVIVGGFFVYRKMSTNDNSIDREQKTGLSQEEKNSNTESTTQLTTSTPTSIKQTESTKKTEDKNYTNLKQGKLIEEFKDGDYHRYSFLVDIEKPEECLYKINSYNIRIKPLYDVDYGAFKIELSVNNKLLFDGFLEDDFLNYNDDESQMDDGKAIVYIHVYGQYIALEFYENDYDGDKVFIATPDNKVIDITGYITEDTFTKDRIRFHSFIQVQDEEGDCELILTPDEEKKKTIYSSYIIYEYKNGILDTKGKKTDIVSLYDYYKDRDPKVYQEEYDYCKEHWGNKSE